MLSRRWIERILIYRRALQGMLAGGEEMVSSTLLAEEAGCTPDLVRRDLMQVPYSGSPRKGYQVAGLLEGINQVLKSEERVSVALVGLGNLGRAVLGYISSRESHLSVTAIFDKSSALVGRNFGDLSCNHVENLVAIIRKHDIHLGIVTVPAAGAQGVADAMVAAGVRGILNFAPVSISVPTDVVVENIDILVALESTALLAGGPEQPAPEGNAGA